MKNRIVLSQKQSYLLLTAVSADYTASGLSDGEFATKYEEKVAPGLNASHVGTARRSLEIPANILPGQTTGPNASMLVINMLSTRISMLENTVSAQGDTIRALQKSVDYLTTHRVLP